MLTKNDLKALDEMMDRKLDEKLDQKLDPIKKDITEIRKDSKTIVNYFDNEYLEYAPELKESSE